MVIPNFDDTHYRLSVVSVVAINAVDIINEVGW